MNALTQLNKLFKFNGGVHPPENKTQSTQAAIGQLPLPALLTLPLRQHIGNMPKVLVNVGDHVLKGQLIAETEGSVSAAIHAPTSGEIIAIEDAVIPHPSGLPDRCVQLKPDGKDAWIAHQGQDWQNTDRKTLIGRVRLSGIVGLGGATFPSHIKLRPSRKDGIHTLVINAAECEPYITCDDMLMRERADAIVKGIQIAQYLLDADKVIIGIEDNKSQAIIALNQAVANTDIQVAVVPTLYPSGDARRLVHLLTGTEIPHNKRSTDIGIQVFNVATVYAMHRYFDYGEPSISRIVSMTGNVENPQNFEVLFGTPLPHLIDAAGGAKADTSHYIMGGPMMGFDLPELNVPITKASNCIIAAAPDLFAAPPPAMPCIRCARCADACPVSLQPQELYWFAKSDNFEKAREYKLFDCIECGACSYVCPSNIPLVQYYRYAKSEIIAEDKAKEAANLARERNEARIARIEREKQERAEKHAARAKGKKKPTATKTATNSQTDDAKKAAIAAALARAKAQKETGEAPKNTEPENDHVKQKMAEIDARRQSVGLTDNASSANKTDDDKQAAIQAAIAKAKAAKANKSGNSASKTDKATLSDAEKQAKIAEAIAKAKAKKAESAKNNTEKAVNPSADADKAKQEKITAAIAKAKAKKAAADAAKQEKE